MKNKNKFLNSIKNPQDLIAQFAFYSSKKNKIAKSKDAHPKATSSLSPYLRGFFVFVILLIGIMFFSFSFVSGTDVFSETGSAYGSYSGSGYSGSYQYQQPSFNDYYSSEQISTYWPILSDMEEGQCNNEQGDFFVTISPKGCTPMVVRSDLLEEQNVPVFCQLTSVQINPLIEVSSIKHITFKGDWPEEVVDVSFHPAQAAINSYKTTLGNPVLNNIGYVVIVLKRTAVEDEMPDWIFGNLTAVMEYDAEKAYGAGQSEYYLPIVADDEWERTYQESAFWKGKGYVRLEEINEGVAKVGLYSSKDVLFSTAYLKKGETSDVVYFPGYYCDAGVRVKLNNIVSSDKQVLLEVDGSDLWVREGDSILGNCKVKNIVVTGESVGSVKIYCPGNTFDLVLQREGLNIDVDGETENYNIGDVVFEAGLTQKDKIRDWYLLFADRVPGNIEDAGGKQSIGILVDSLNIKVDSSRIALAYEAFEEAKSSKTLFKNLEEFGKAFNASLGKRGISGVKGYGFGYDGDVGEIYIEEKNSEGKLVRKKTSFTYGVFETKEILDEESLNAIGENYFEGGVEVVGDLVENFPNEQKDNGEYYTEEALFKQIQLAKQVKKFKTQLNLTDLFLQKYPASSSANYLEKEKMELGYFDFSSAGKSVYVSNEYHFILAKNFKDVDLSTKEVDLNVGGARQIASIGNEIYYNGQNTNDDYLVVKKIEPEYIVVDFYNVIDDDGKKISSPRGSSYKLELGVSKVIDKKELLVNNIDVKQYASVSIIPEVDTQSEADFTFRIGIEKRAIELSPEKTQEMIDNLNKTIAEWEELVENLGTLIKGWKGACFATSTFLMVKNTVDGFSGKTLARQDVMDKYEEICAEKYPSMKKSECYSKLSSEIDKAVEERANYLNAVNSKMDRIIDSQETTSDLFDNKIVDQEAYRKALIADLKNSGVSEVEVDGKKVSIDDATTTEQLRTAYMWKESQAGSSLNKEIAQKELDSAWASVLTSRETTQVSSALKENYGVDMHFTDMNTNAKEIYWVGDVASSGIAGLSGNVNEGDKLFGIRHSDGKDYIVAVNSEKQIKEIFAYSGSGLSIADEKVKNKIISDYRFVDGGACSYPYKKPVVRYYDSGSNSGLPAIVPFDLKNGWYVKVSNSAGTFLENTEQGYTASGAVSNFKICNVGKDGMEDNEGDDDVCQTFDVNTMNKVDVFLPCGKALSSSQVKDLVKRAQQAIKEAQQQSSSSGSVRILGQDIDKSTPLSDTGSVECQDYMSPEDCKLLFNVCDPVICPASRCDLGGKWPVADVVQSGILGSIMLCLPNANEVMVPICLTGIHAGLDSYLSILKSERDCLETSLETGEHVGICDQLTSIYVCEFFWRQFAPVMDLLIPKFIELAYGGFQSTRGGGEYLTIQSSWDALQGNIDYFKNNYAQNAFRAFQYKSVEEAGGEFCRAFIGSSVPTDGDLLDSLLEPESPAQFYAWFSETTYTEATVPSTSHYKVYYHIYSGNDKGTYYRVYLRDPPASSYYNINQQVFVKTGYVEKGKSADESIDFTAPSGYKELCVELDGELNCGFKQVTSDFGLEYLQAKYTEDQVFSDVTTEQDCISGTASVYGLVNPNIQAGVEEAVNPDITLRGIVRVCATDDPNFVKDYSSSETSDSSASSGSGTTSNGSYVPSNVRTTEIPASQRWVEVGYCGDKEVKCWLDTWSVEDDLKKVWAVENSSLAELEGQIGGILSNTIKSYEDVVKLLSNLRKEINGLGASELKTPTNKTESIILQLDWIAGIGDGVSGQGTNRNKAEALVLKVGLFSMIVQANYDGTVEKPTDDDVEKLLKNGAEDEIVILDEEMPEDFGSDLSDDITSYTEDEPYFCDDEESKICLNGVYTNIYVNENNRIYEDIDNWFDNPIGLLTPSGFLDFTINEIKSDDVKDVAEEIKGKEIVLEGSVVDAIKNSENLINFHNELMVGDYILKNSMNPSYEEITKIEIINLYVYVYVSDEDDWTYKLTETGRFDAGISICKVVRNGKIIFSNSQCSGDNVEIPKE